MEDKWLQHSNYSAEIIWCNCRAIRTLITFETWEKYNIFWMGGGKLYRTIILRTFRVRFLTRHQDANATKSQTLVICLINHSNFVPLSHIKAESLHRLGTWTGVLQEGTRWLEWFRSTSWHSELLDLWLDYPARPPSPTSPPSPHQAPQPNPFSDWERCGTAKETNANARFGGRFGVPQLSARSNFVGRS